MPKRLEKHPIPDSYWVQPGQLLAGEYPRNKDDASSRLKLRRLLQAGVTFFLDLTEAGEYNLKPYTELLQQEATGMGHTALHRRLPIPDGDTPTPEEMIRILDTIDEALSAGQVVYVHCWGGIGRTGTVAGCHLVRHGMTGEDALAQIARLRQDTPDGHRVSPETEAQAEMIRAWREGR